MAADLTLHELPDSPNSARVRIALGYKGIPWESRPIDPEDRSPIVRLSTQPRVPVIEHGSTVLFDSWAILRYLDASFPDTPRLYRADRGAMREIERWETFTRARLGPAIEMLLEQAFSGRAPDAGALREANELFRGATETVEAALASTGWLLDDALSAADLGPGPVVAIGMIPGDVRPGSPLVDFFREHLHLGDGRERTRAWVGRIRAYDR